MSGIIPIGMATFQPVGRMGNFLFKAASTIGYAMRNGIGYSVPGQTNDPKWNPVYMPHLVSQHFQPHLPTIRIREGRDFAFHELPFQQSWRSRNILLDGYWQSERYFAEYREQVLRAFGFPWISMPGLVSVHVRRTDYLELKHKHPEVTAPWYEAQMGKFDGARFRFFSDDIAWCQQQFGGRADVEFSVGRSEVQDLIDMSCCEHHICSASTFAWWGAWLNRNAGKRIIMPKQWFMPGHGGLDTKDIVPSNWERA